MIDAKTLDELEILRNNAEDTEEVEEYVQQLLEHAPALIEAARENVWRPITQYSFDGEEVIVLGKDKYGKVFVEQNFAYGDGFFSGRVYSNVTHYKPLPTPPTDI